MIKRFLIITVLIVASATPIYSKEIPPILLSEKEFVVWGFVVTILDTTPCDGEKARIRIDQVPSTVDRSVLSQLSNIQLIASTRDPSQGNPAGTTILTFEPLSSNYESKIQNAIWYSTQADHCNVKSVYEITATAELNGVTLSTASPAFLTVSTAKTCLDGEATIANEFSGSHQVNTQFVGSQWEATIAQGTFRREVRATCWWRAPANSQYHDMVRDEEQFHVGQLEGTTSNILADLWDDQLVMNAVKANEPYTGLTEVQAHSNAWNAFLVELQAEIIRSRTLAFSIPPAGRRCEVEAEAKNHAGASHRVAMPCAYSACP